MIRTHRRSKRPAWLAMVAIWLIIVAPVVSQLLAGCASGGAVSSTQQMSHMQHPCAPDPQNPQPHPMTFCGYCSLFHHTSLLASASWQPTLPGSLSYPPLVAPAVRRPIVQHMLAAAPRGPPIFAHA